MKFDKDIVIAVIICAAILFGWEPLCRYMGWISDPVPAAAAPANAAPDKKIATAPAAGKTAAAPAAPAENKRPAVQAKPQTAALPAEILSNADLSYKITPATGTVNAITLIRYKNAERTAPVVIDDGRGALAVSSTSGWTVEETSVSRPSDLSVILVRTIRDAAGSQFKLIQKWELEKTGYAAKYSVSFANPGKEKIMLSGITVNGGDLAPWQIVSGDKVRIPSHRMDYMTASGSCKDIKADKKDSGFFLNPAPVIKWVALSNKYFTSILDSDTPFQMVQSRQYLKEGETDYYQISAGMKLGDIALAPGENKRFDFSFYSGPKIIADLDKFDPSTGRVMHLAWGPLDYLARLLLWLLVKFHALLGSYGWSIVLLTAVVRLVFYPLTARGNTSMRKMQIVQPQLKAIREKYKDNPQLMNTKMMELYRKEGVNPFGGCLPILLQIPVFFALYATLDGAVELRQVSFLWCKDLAAADTVATIPLYFFSLPINPLVLAMTALMVVQQHMTPMSMDPMQKKMMALMPVIMLFMLYDLPSGLTLYWTVSNFFSIIQLKLQQRARNSLNAPETAGAK